MEELPKNTKKDESPEKTLQILEENIKLFEEQELDHFPDRLTIEAESLGKLVTLAKDDKFSLGEIEVVQEKLKDIKGGIEGMIIRVDSYMKSREKKIDIELNK